MNAIIDQYISSMDKIVVPARQATQAGGIGSFESIIGLLKSLKIRPQFFFSPIDGSTKK
jgi:hypothetical protein